MRNPYLSTEIDIGRDTNIIKSEPVLGQMTFQDNVVTTPVTLNDLLGASGSSSQIILAEVASVSGNLQSQIDTIDGQIDTINDEIDNISTGSILEYVSVPSSPTDTGTQGQRAYDSNYVYECVATNTWVRYAAASSW